MDAGYAVDIAGSPLRIAGDHGIQAIRQAFGPIEISTVLGSPPLLRVDTEKDPAGFDGWRDWQVGSHRDAEGRLVVIRRDPSSIETYTPGQPPLLHLRGSSAAWASGDLLAQPAHFAIAAWLASSTRQMVHAGAVCLDGRGVLFIGPGGSGKSTAALACACSGFSYHGDDLCIVEVGGIDRPAPPRVHGLYATAKLNPDSRDRLQARGWPVLGLTPKGKTTVTLPSHIRFQRSSPLVAIVAFHSSGPSARGSRRLDKKSTMARLAATGLPVATGSGTPGQWLATIAELARHVPAYEIPRSWDLEHMVNEIRDLVDQAVVPSPL